MGHQQPSYTHGASADIIVALTEYRTEMLDDLRGMELPEGVALGDQMMTSTLEDKWPVATGSVTYEETVGDHPNLTEWGEKFFTLTTKDFSGGVIAKAATLRTTEWAAHGWQQAPQENADAYMYKFEELLAAALEDGASTASWMKASKKVFDTGKPADPNNPSNGHTVDNLHSKALTVPNVEALRQILRMQKNPAGRPAGKRLTHIVCGPDLEDTLLAIIKDPVIVATYGSSATQSATMVTNSIATHFPGIIPIILPTLTDPGVWYPIAGRAGRKMPWLSLLKRFARDGNAAGLPNVGIQAADGLEWIMLDESSDHYKYGSKLGPAKTVASWSTARMGCAITRELDIHRCEP